MTLDLGKYALNIALAYGATVAMLVLMAAISFAAARRIRRQLKDMT